MKNPNNNKSSSFMLCPTCGTKLPENATRCLVCGRTFSRKTASAKSKSVRSQRLPDVTLSLPLALGPRVSRPGHRRRIDLPCAALAPVKLQLQKRLQRPAPRPHLSRAPRPPQHQPLCPRLRLLSPVEYTIKDGDQCIAIAYAYGVTVKSITDLNNLGIDCGVLSVGQTILIPQPHPNSFPHGNCNLEHRPGDPRLPAIRYSYNVGENDTLSGIAANYNISVETLKVYNGLTSNNIYSGQSLTIPLCERLPTSGPTPTPTNPPPYAATNLLLPADGAVFDNTTDTVTLQWAAVPGMLEGEVYTVTVEDLTEGQGKKLVDYASDTKYTVPVTFKPTTGTPHVIRWWIQPVRQSGTDWTVAIQSGCRQVPPVIHAYSPGPASAQPQQAAP